MQFRKALIVALAAAVAIAFAPLPELRAAPYAGKGSQVAGSDLVHTVAKKKMKKKKAGKKKRGKKGKKAKKASCGTFMYRKGGKCVDARNKK